MTSKAKNVMSSWLIPMLGVGILGSLFYSQFSGKERQRERKAFRELDLSTMTLKDIWDRALDFGRKRRTELAHDNAELKELVEHGAGLIEVSEGLQKCATMVTDPSVSEAVKMPILEHWHEKWWQLMGLDTMMMEKLFESIDSMSFEKIRQRLADHDKRVEEREREAREEPGYGVLSCSFCGKSQKEVEKIVAGPSVYICNECIGLCQDILAEECTKTAAETTQVSEESDDDAG